MLGTQEMFAEPVLLWSMSPVLPHDLKVLICLNHETLSIHGLTAILNFLCIRMMSRNITSIDLATRFFRRNLENISTFFYLKIIIIVAYLEVITIHW